MEEAKSKAAAAALKRFEENKQNSRSNLYSPSKKTYKTDDLDLAIAISLSEDSHTCNNNNKHVCGENCSSKTAETYRLLKNKNNNNNNNSEDIDFLIAAKIHYREHGYFLGGVSIDMETQILAMIQAEEEQQMNEDSMLASALQNL